MLFVAPKLKVQIHRLTYQMKVGNELISVVVGDN